MNKSDRAKVASGVLFIILVIIGYVIELPVLINTFSVSSLMYLSAIMALIVAGVCYYLYFRLYTELYDQFVSIMGVFVLSILFFPLLISRTNRLFVKKASSEQLKLIDWSARSSQPYGVIDSSAVVVDGYQLLVEYENAEESVLVKNRSAFTLTDDKVVLRIKKGLWGFAYVVE